MITNMTDGQFVILRRNQDSNKPKFQLPHRQKGQIIENLTTKIYGVQCCTINNSFKNTKFYVYNTLYFTKIDSNTLNHIQ